MKKYILLVMFISLFIYACDDDDNNKGHIDPVSNVECIPFIGSVTLNWVNPTDANYYYTLISYRNSQGENVNKKVSKYSADANSNVWIWWRILIFCNGERCSSGYRGGKRLCNRNR